MKVAVLMSAGQDPKFPLKLEPFKGITRKGRPILNPLDDIALEMALEVKASKRLSITVIGVGGIGVEGILKTCMARGADEAYLVKVGSDNKLDPVKTGQALAEIIGKESYSIIFSGSTSLDMGGAIVPAVIAQLLGMPVISRVRKMEINEDKKTCSISRKTRGYTELLEADLPVVLAVEMGPEPRQASLRRMIRKRNAQVTMVQAPAGLASVVNIEKFTQPKPRKKRSLSLPASASGADRLDALMVGAKSASSRVSSVVEFEPKEAPKMLAGIIKKALEQS